MKRNVSRQYKEEYEAAMEAVGEEVAWDIAVQIWDGKAANRTTGSKVLTMKKKESAARSIPKMATPKRRVIERRAAA